MASLYILLQMILNLAWFFVIAQVIMSWLVAFNVLNTRNRFVHTVYDMLNRLVEPLARPIRRFMPNLGGIDITPIILLLLIHFLQLLLAEYWPIQSF